MCIGAGTVSFHGLEAGAGARGLWEEEGEGWEGGREAAVGGRGQRSGETEAGVAASDGGGGPRDCDPLKGGTGDRGV